MKYRAFLLVFAGLLVGLTGCKAEECRVMDRCCAAVAGTPGLGAACGPLSEGLKDPTTCRSVVETVQYMLEGKEQPVPEACKL